MQHNPAEIALNSIGPNVKTVAGISRTLRTRASGNLSAANIQQSESIIPDKPENSVIDCLSTDGKSLTLQGVT